MLNWIDKRERLPTDEDANEKRLVYAISRDNSVSLWNISHFTKQTSGPIYWLPYREMPIPKKWRTATINDLAKAGKPIPCRVRDGDKDEWQDTHLVAVSVAVTHWPFVTELYDEDSDTHSWHLCEILDQE